VTPVRRNVIFNFSILFFMIPLAVKREGCKWPSGVWSDERSWHIQSKSARLFIVLPQRRWAYQMELSHLRGQLWIDQWRETLESWIFLFCFRIFLVHCLCFRVVRQWNIFVKCPIHERILHAFSRDSARILPLYLQKDSLWADSTRFPPCAGLLYLSAT